MERLAPVPGVRFALGATAHARATKTEWYDRLVLDDGRVAVMFGHVPDALHGTQITSAKTTSAQATSAQATSAVQRMRGAVCVAVEHGAAGAIAMLHRYARHDNTLEGAALCVALFDPVKGELACSSAGWPGPWLVAASGPVRQLQSAGSGPLGSDIAGDLPVESVHRVNVGDHVLLHAARSTDTRAALVRLIDHHGPGDPQGVCDALDAAAAVGDGDGPHALVLTVTGDAVTSEPLTIEVPADPRQLPMLRARLDEWLRAASCPGELSERLVLATNEAVTNSIVHAYRGSDLGDVRVTAEVERDRSIRVTVTDQGRWQPAEPGDGAGGRGVLMMQECADRVVIDRSERGTTVSLEVLYHTLPGSAVRSGRGDASRRHRLVVRTSGDTTIAHLFGDVPESASAMLRRQLLTATCGGVVPLIVDLGDIGSDTEGLIPAHGGGARAADGAGERVVVVAPPGSRAADRGALDGLGHVVELVPTLRSQGDPLGHYLGDHSLGRSLGR